MKECRKYGASRMLLLVLIWFGAAANASAVPFQITNVQGRIDIFGADEERFIDIIGGSGVFDLNEAGLFNAVLDLDGEIHALNRQIIPIIEATLAFAGQPTLMPGFEPIHLARERGLIVPRGFGDTTAAHANFWDAIGRDITVQFPDGIFVAANPENNTIYLEAARSFVPGHAPGHTSLALTYVPIDAPHAPPPPPHSEIPEPASMLLLGLGLAGAGMRRRRA